MHTLKHHIFFISIILLSINLTAQDFTGTWEGKLSTDQFLRLNIIQTGNKICGYTEDHILADKRSFCKAFFEGYYDTKRERLIISGKFFLKNSGEHILMNLKLKLKTTRNGEFLDQAPVRTIAYRERQSIFGIEIEPYIAYDSTEYVHIKKVADQPYEFIDLMKDCIARDKKETDTIVKVGPPKSKDSLPPVVKVVVSPKPKDSLPSVVKVIVPEKPKDTVQPVVVKPPVKKDSIVVPKTITQRKNIEQSHLEVNVKTLNLKVYDNAIIDGDTVSILYNGKTLLAYQLLSEKGIELNIELDEKQTRHEITLFAHNLGSIPPNTALIVITAGKKRYELFASASLEENAVLVFDYKPQ